MRLLPHKTVLAIGAVIDIALHSGEGAVSAHNVADRLDLPRRHLEPVLQALVREGILAGVRGQWGGYMLAGARQAISIYDISEAVKTVEKEEPNKDLAWLLGAVVLPTLAQAEEHLESSLKRITVEADNRRRLGAGREPPDARQLQAGRTSSVGTLVRARRRQPLSAGSVILGPLFLPMFQQSPPQERLSQANVRRIFTPAISQATRGISSYQ